MKRHAVLFKGICLVCILTLFSVCFTGRSRVDAQGIKNFNIFVDVGCKNKSTKTLIESWIKRELRSLPDVNVVHNAINANSAIKLAALETPFGEIKRISLGYTFFHIFRNNNISWCSEPSISVVAGTTSLHLEEICKRIVATIDIDHLEQLRR